MMTPSDSEWLSNFTSDLSASPAPSLTSKESASQVSCLSQLRLFSGTQWVRCGWDNFLSKKRVQGGGEGREMGMGRVEGRVNCTPFEMLGWLWHFDSDQAMNVHSKSCRGQTDFYPREILKRVNDHNQVSTNPNPKIALKCSTSIRLALAWK